jgi:hypothetical protein
MAQSIDFGKKHKGNIMNVSVDRSALKTTLGWMKRQQGRPYFQLYAREDGLWVYGYNGSDSVPVSMFTAMQIPGETKETGDCTVDSRLVSLLPYAGSDEVHLVTTEKSMMIKTNSGFKARLQLLDIPSLGTLEDYEARAEALYKGLSLILPVEPLRDLVALSKLYPPESAEGASVVILTIDSQACTISGSIQSSEIGSIEEFVFAFLPDQSNPLDCLLILDADTLSDVIAPCGEFVKLLGGPERKNAVVVSDPDNRSWWSILSQMSSRKYDSKE